MKKYITLRRLFVFQKFEESLEPFSEVTILRITGNRRQTVEIMSEKGLILCPFDSETLIEKEFFESPLYQLMREDEQV